MYWSFPVPRALFQRLWYQISCGSFGSWLLDQWRVDVQMFLGWIHLKSAGWHGASGHSIFKVGGTRFSDTNHIVGYVSIIFLPYPPYDLFYILHSPLLHTPILLICVTPQKTCSIHCWWNHHVPPVFFGGRHVGFLVEPRISGDAECCVQQCGCK